jgi:hypothetical protein
MVPIYVCSSSVYNCGNFNPLEPSSYYMYHLLYHTKTWHSTYTLDLRVPYESHDKTAIISPNSISRMVLVTEI